MVHATDAEAGVAAASATDTTIHAKNPAINSENMAVSAQMRLFILGSFLPNKTDAFCW
jgi:hypothetical protein